MMSVSDGLWRLVCLCVLRDDGEFLLYVWGVTCVKTDG